MRNLTSIRLASIRFAVVPFALALLSPAACTSPDDELTDDAEEVTVRPCADTLVTAGSKIASKWTALGGTTGFLGAPVGPAAQSALGFYRPYAGGHIYWTCATGAHEVHGDVLGLYGWYGHDWGALALPTSDETVAPDGVGHVTSFQGGGIYHTAATGTHAVQGLIHQAYAAAGATQSALGYPVYEEAYATARTLGASWSDFENGVIVRRTTDATAKVWPASPSSRSPAQVRALVMNTVAPLFDPDDQLGTPVALANAYVNGATEYAYDGQRGRLVMVELDVQFITCGIEGCGYTTASAYTTWEIRDEGSQLIGTLRTIDKDPAIGWWTGLDALLDVDTWFGDLPSYVLTAKVMPTGGVNLYVLLQ